MKPYIYGKRNALHIIDIKETIRGLLLARKFLTKTVSEGNNVIFVGTKRQAKKSVMTHAERLGMYWVTDRWIGGTLTNFREIRKRVRRLEELEQMETDGTMDVYSKKEGSRLRRELRKIRRNLGGIRHMEKFPGAMVVIDPTRENIAVREANKLKIPVIALIDTEANPDPVDIPIPGNDDAMRSIELVVRELASAVEMGLKVQVPAVEEEDTAPRRRSRRPTTARANDIPDYEPPEEAAEEPETETVTETSPEAASEATSEAAPEAEPAPEPQPEAETAAEEPAPEPPAEPEAETEEAKEDE
jgi:small subunit ribosomal protein S2